MNDDSTIITITTTRTTPGACPLPREQVIERYFLEHRQKVLDIAAFLDRVDRAVPDAGSPAQDHRIHALLRAIDVLNDGKPHRARRVLEVLSDPTGSPAPGAAGPATGAPPPP